MGFDVPHGAATEDPEGGFALAAGQDSRRGENQGSPEHRAWVVQSGCQSLFSRTRGTRLRLCRPSLVLVPADQIGVDSPLARFGVDGVMA